MIHRLLSPLILALTVAGASMAAGPDRAAAITRMGREAHLQGLIDQAANAMNAKRFDAALKMAEEAAAIQPGNPVTLNTKAAALIELHRYAEAQLVLTEAIKADPQAFAPQFNQGELLALQKKFAEAAVHFTILQSRFGDIPLLKFKIYLCSALAGQTDSAAKALQNVRYPEDGAAWYFAHAADLLVTGKRDEALELIAAAKAIHQEDAHTYESTLRDNGLLK